MFDSNYCHLKHTIFPSTSQIVFSTKGKKIKCRILQCKRKCFDNKVKWKCTFHIVRKIEFGMVYYETFQLGTQFLENLKIPRKMSWSDALCMFNGTKWKRIRWKRFIVVVNVIICSLQFAFYMLWHRKCHVYPIDRACCALNATAKIPNTCDTHFLKQ